MNPFQSTIESFLLKMKDQDFKNHLKFNELIIGGGIWNWTPVVSYDGSKLYIVNDFKDNEFTIRVNHLEMRYGATIFKKYRESNESIGDWIENCFKNLLKDHLNFKQFQEKFPFIDTWQNSFSGYEMHCDDLKIHVEKSGRIGRNTSTDFYLQVFIGDKEIKQYILPSSVSFEGIFMGAVSSLSLEEQMMLKDEVRDLL